MDMDLVANATSLAGPAGWLLAEGKVYDPPEPDWL